ncbi:hypothetical protein FACS189459_1160 [Bacilli bacterium]|nr:hypothetical protein FACS189459_1160 [Bacilli bacterium]
MKSTISLIKEIPLDQEVVITQLVGKKDQDKNDAQQLTKLFPNASQEEINKMVLNKFLNENAFSACMDVIYKCCEIKYDDEEVKKVIDDLRKNFKDLTDKKDEQLLNIAQHLIAKPLIFNLLAEK